MHFTTEINWVEMIHLAANLVLIWAASPQNLSLQFLTRSDTNRAVQPQKIHVARDLKFWIQQVEGLYYLCSENKGADQLCSYLRLCFHIYAKCRFPHFAAQFTRNNLCFNAFLNWATSWGNLLFAYANKQRCWSAEHLCWLMISTIYIHCQDSTIFYP